MRRCWVAAVLVIGALAGCGSTKIVTQTVTNTQTETVAVVRTVTVEAVARTVTKRAIALRRPRVVVTA